MRQRHTVAGCALILFLDFGCGPTWVKNQPLNNPVYLVDLTPDGTIEVAGKRRFKLAGIRMRFDNETGEPNALRAVKVVVGPQVEISGDSSDVPVVAYFKQAPGFICGTGMMSLNPLNCLRTVPLYQRGCLNALLIRLGLAAFDSTATLDDKVRDRLAEAQAGYAAGVARVREEQSVRFHFYEPISALVKYPGRVTSRWRVAFGDLPKPIQQFWQCVAKWKETGEAPSLNCDRCEGPIRLIRNEGDGEAHCPCGRYDVFLW